MEPLGTITKYYAFIDEETQSVLNSLMAESSSYSDLIQRLTTHIIDNESSTDLVHIVTVQVWCTKEAKLMDLISESLGHVEIIQPWIESFKTLQYYSPNYELFQRILDDFTDSSVADWRVIELFLLHSFNMRMSLESQRLLSRAKDLLSKNSDLECFRPLVNMADGYLEWLEGKRSVGLTHLEKGLELARENDDGVYEYYSLLSLANCKKQLHYQDGLDVFEEAYTIAQDLDVSFFVCEILNDATMAYEIAGLYDLALSSQFDGIEAYPNEIGIEVCYGILSRLYASLGDGHSALEWADRYMEILPSHVAYLRKARALIVLDRLDEAEELLEIAHQKVLEIGSDAYFGRYYFVSGLLEMARGELDSAMATLEQAYDIFNPYAGTVFSNECMIALAKLEVLLSQSEKRNQIGSKKWLSTLEDFARTNDLPGILMQAAMIKSELYQSRREFRDAHETLRQALKLSDSSGVKTLTKMISTRIQELEKILRDQELVS